MRRRRFIAPLVLLAASAGLALGLAELFQLRFSAGDVYPPYSTLRSDPLGAKALYATLREIPGVQVERNLRPLHRALEPGVAPRAFFHLGASAADWPRIFSADEADRVDRFLRHGGRVIIAFAPTDTLPTLGSTKRSEGDNAKSVEAEERPVDLAGRWRVDFRRIDPAAATRRAPAVPEARLAPGAPEIEPAASWHSAPDFELNERALVAGWTPIYLRGDHPVLITRVYPGGGLLALASDAFLFSNEALRNEPHPALLAHLIGPACRAVFDETHFGINETLGVMALARRFHLAAALAALAALAGLFLWKGASSLVPSPPDAADRALAGRDSGSGFLSLIRRSVPPRELLATCLAKWEPGASPAAVTRLRDILAAEAAKPRKERNLVAAYRAMCEAAKKPGPSA